MWKEDLINALDHYLVISSPLFQECDTSGWIVYSYKQWSNQMYESKLMNHFQFPTSNNKVVF